MLRARAQRKIRDKSMNFGFGFLSRFRFSYDTHLGMDGRIAVSRPGAWGCVHSVLLDISFSPSHCETEIPDHPSM